MRGRKQLSAVLIVSMIASLFAGTAMGAVGKSGGGLFTGTPTVLVSEDDSQAAQRFDVAASASNAKAWEASPSDAIADVAAVEGKAQIEITPNKVSGDLLKMATIADGTGTYSGKVKFAWNLFKNGAMEIEEGSAENRLIFGTKASASSAIDYSTSPSGKLEVTPTTGGVNLKSSGTKLTEDTVVTVTAKTDGKTVGICNVTIKKKAEDPGSPAFLKGTPINVNKGETAEIELTDYGKELLSSSPDKITASVEPDTIASAEIKDQALTVTGKAEGTARVKVTYPDKADDSKTKTDTCQVTVTWEPTGDFFTADTVTVVKGRVNQLPVKSEVWQAVRDGDATYAFEDTDFYGRVAEISEKSGAIAYVKGIKAGKTMLRIDYEGERDFCTIYIVDGKKATLFDLGKDKTVTAKAGEEAVIKLTEDAVSWIDRFDDYGFVLSDPSLWEEPELSWEKDDSACTVYMRAGMKEGKTELLLRIGVEEENSDGDITDHVDYVDVCTLEITPNYAGQLDGILDGVDETMSAERLQGIVEAIKALAEEIREAGSVESLNDPDSDTANSQMQQLQILDTLLAEKSNITIKEPSVDASLQALFGDITCAGLGLNADEGTAVQLVAKSADAILDGTTLTNQAVAIDLTLNVGDKKNQKPSALFCVMMDIPEALRGKTIVVYHEHDGNVTTIHPYIDGDRMWFFITNLSTFVIDEGDVEMATVLLKKPEGGHFSIYSQSFSADEEKYRIYVPAGERVKVPVGTELTLEYLTGTGYKFRDVKVKEGDGEPVSYNEDYFTDRRRRGSFTLENASDYTFTPAFEKKSTGGSLDYYGYSVYCDPGMVESGEALSGQLYVIDNHTDEEVPATNFKIDEELLSEEWFENEYSAEEIHALFTLTPDGELTSKKVDVDWDLRDDYFYGIPVTFEYNGKTHRNDDDDECFAIVEVEWYTVDAIYHYDWFKDSDGRYDYAWREYEESVKGKTFGSLNETNHPRMSMYGGYAFAGWYDRNMSKVSDSTVIGDTFEVYARFKKDGKFYNPNGSPVEDPDNPSPTPSGGNGSSKDRSNYNSYTMHGTWMQTETGWKFRQDSGAYPENRWGWINGSYYYFGEDGIMKTGWVQVAEKWYYFEPTAGADQGKMKTGWQWDPLYNGFFYLDSSGAMVTGWQQNDGKWYYFNPVSDGRRGILYANQRIDGYYVGADGVWDGMPKKEE